MGDSLNLVPATVEDSRRRAEARLPRLLFDYVDGGAGAEVTLRHNVTDFETLRLNQRVMVDVSRIEAGIELFGETLSMPLVLAPVGLAFSAKGTWRIVGLGVKATRHAWPTVRFLSRNDSRQRLEL